ncbi:DDE-type integrase/transposase/recombinase [Mesorhizobium sp. M0847]|uniref:DDE-type integrase/transposase/recombinase n=1 Tax=unclassified Mesorhizobium TaxID=325217 RepID=UPI003336D852
MPARQPLCSCDDQLQAWLASGAEPREGNDPQWLWVADITFLQLAEEFAFLAVVLDAFSRKVVGWALDTHLRASLGIEALEMAIADRQPVPGSLIHHSDRGVQYACGAYSELLHLHGIQASMSRVDNPYDNAKAESGGAFCFLISPSRVTRCTHTTKAA